MSLPSTSAEAQSAGITTSGDDGAIHLDRYRGLDLRAFRDRVEADYVRAVFARHSGNVAATARALGIDRTNLYPILRRHGITRGTL